MPDAMIRCHTHQLLHGAFCGVGGAFSLLIEILERVAHHWEV